MESSTSTGVHVFLLLALLLLPLFMRRSRSLFLGLFALTLIASAPRQAEASCETPNLLIVLDRSGSMSGSKWSTATQAINTITSNYDGKLRFGLITFHSAAEINYGLDACIRDGNNCVRNLQAALSSTKASGGTNLIAAINLAHSHLSTVIQQDSVKNRKNTVMFITDGIASCAHTQTQNLFN
jgi:Mg-chelatase subunit ChlD